MISLIHVSKVFDGKRKATALENVDLEIEKGQIVSIVGPSGSGKSTLLNLIGGLDRPTSGEIRIEGSNLADLSDDDLTRVRRDKIVERHGTRSGDRQNLRRLLGKGGGP